MHRIILSATLLFGLILGAAGCSSANPYRVMETRGQNTEIPMKVIVTSLEDVRPFDRKPATLYWIPLLPYSSYRFSRHDEVYPGSVEPFPRLFSRELAKRLEEAEVFANVEYVPRGEMPPLGSYDLLLTGVLDETTSRGGVSYYGLSIFGDLVWFVGLPKFTRRWDLQATLQLYDGYTGDPIGDSLPVKHSTSRRFFTRYAKEASTRDLLDKITPIWDEFIVALRKEVPSGTDEYWANLRNAGHEYVAKLERESELQRKGSPPTFSFLYPSAGAAVREPNTTVRWSATAPGGAKSLTLVVNNQAIDLGVNPLDLIREDSAPRNFPAQELTIPVRLGLNKLEALVVDHRGNETRASFELRRMPKELTPPDRFALLIGAGSREARSTVEGLAKTLKDPLVGQFASANVDLVSQDSLDADSLTAALNEFGRKPLANQLAFVYLAAPGNADDLTIGSGADAMSLQDFLAQLGRAMATEEMVVILEIDWSGAGGREFMDDLSGLSPRWAIVSSAGQTAPVIRSGGGFLFGKTFAEVLENGMTNRETLTLENVLDAVMDEVETGSGGKMVPVMEGRYRPGITMVERE